MKGHAFFQSEMIMNFRKYIDKIISFFAREPLSYWDLDSNEGPKKITAFWTTAI